jgi:hypothetical protein
MNLTPRLRQAVALLSKATGATSRVEPVAADHAGKFGVLLEIRNDKGECARLRVQLWGQPEPEEASTAVVWVLPRGDRGLRKHLRERDESFVDPGGAVRIHLPWMFIDRTDLEPVRLPSVRETRNPFSDRGSLLIRTMLDAGPQEEWSVRALAEAAGVSLGLSSYGISALEKRGLVTAKADGRTKVIQLTDPVALIEAWTRAYDWRKNRAATFHAPVGSPERFLRRLPSCLGGRRWALTLQAGASLVAPHATWDHIHLYVEAQDPDELLGVGEQNGWTSGTGGRVTLMTPFYKDSVWHGCQTIEALPVVSTLQLILDLWHFPIRGREQAEHLMTLANLAAPSDG